jgi:hypothetical protein
MTQTVIKVAFFLSMLGVFSCSNDVVIGPNKPKPKAFGKMNDVVILSEKTIWEGAVGDSIRYYFGGEFPVTPRPEPLFDLRYFPTEKVEYEEALRELRTYIVVVDLSDEESSTTKMLKKDLGEIKFDQAKADPTFTTSVGKNKWATNQILIYVFGNGHDDLFTQIRENFPAMATRIKNHDAEQLASLTYATGDNIGLTNEVKSRYGFDIRIPADFRVILDDEENNFFWLRKEVEGVGVMSMSFSEYPYETTEQLSIESFKAMRNKHGSDRTYSTEANSIMRINDIDMPILVYPFNKDGSYGKEFRGIWELDNDFIGGPFISYLFINESKNTVLLVDSWVMAPGKTKRKYLQQLELIVKGK